MFSRLVPVLLIGLSIAAFFSVIKPRYEEIGEMQAEQEMLNEALGRAKELQALRNDLLKKYNTFTANDLDRLEKLVPDHVDNVRLIIDIDAIASRYGLSVHNLAIIRQAEGSEDNGSGQTVARTLRERQAQANVITGEQTESNIRAVELSFSVVSSYGTFLQFLRDLERSLRVIDITALNFTSTGEGDFYTFDTTIRAYWLSRES